MRKHLGNKRFQLSKIDSQISLLYGCNMSGKTKSIQLLHNVLTDRGQNVVLVDCSQIKEYNDLEREVDKVKLLESVLKQIPKQGYFLLDNFDKVFDYASSNILLKRLKSAISKEEYLYCIMSISTLDSILIFQNQGCTFFNNETGKIVDYNNLTIQEYKKIVNTRKYELERRF